MKHTLITLCVIASVGAVVIAVGCPVLQQVDIPCESSYDCPTGYGCGDKKICVGNLPESVLTVSPAQVDVTVSNSTTFTATIDGRTVDVNWALDPSDGTAGTIDSTGLYVAPATVPSQDTATVWASLKRHSQLQASVTLRIVPMQPDAGADAGSGDADTNLIPDPSFESSDPTIWYAWQGELTKTTNDPHSGKQCLCEYAAFRNSDWVGPVYDLTNQITPGAVYQVDSWVRTGGTGTTTIKMDYKTTCEAGDGGTASIYSNALIDSTAPAGQWVELSHAITVPKCLSSSFFGNRFELYFDGPPGGADAGVDICIDDVTVRPMSTQ